MNNISVEDDKKEIKIVLDTRIYGLGAIMEASKDYGETCWIYVDGDVNDKILVSIKPKVKEIDINTLGLEFCNYVLGIMQNAIMQA